jgi:hypothetical protein
MLNQAPLHEDIWGSEGTAPFILHSLNEDEWSASQLTALAPERETPVPSGEEAGWTPELYWTRWRREKKFLPSPGIEPRPSSS